MLCRSASSEKPVERDILQSTVGLLFFGTPQRELSKGIITTIVQKFHGDAAISCTGGANSVSAWARKMDELCEPFKIVLSSHGIQVASFLEGTSPASGEKVDFPFTPSYFQID